MRFRKLTALVSLVLLGALTGGIGVMVWTVRLELKDLEVDPAELRIGIVDWDGRHYLCVDGPKHNHFADVQFPVWELQEKSIVIQFKWSRRFLGPVQSIHTDWPLLIGPLAPEMSGKAVVLAPTHAPLGVLQFTDGRWIVTKARQGQMSEP